MSKNLQVSTAYILVHLAQIFFIYPIDIMESTDQVHWLPVLFGSLFNLIMISIYLKGLSYFKDQNIIEILMKKNKFLAWFFFLHALLYLGSMIILTVRGFAEVISITVLSNTPIWVLILLFLTIPGYIVLQGMIGGILRLSVLISALFVVPVIFVILASFQNVDWHYLLPLWTGFSDFKFVTNPSFYMSLFACSGGFLMIGFLPSFTKFKPKAIYWGALALLPAYLISVYVPILTFGEQTARQLQFPYIFVVDTIEINWLMFERINVFLLLGLVAFCMFFISVSLWQILCIIQQGVRNINSNYLIPIILIPLYICCLYIPDWDTSIQLLQWSMAFRLYVMVTTPVYLLIIGWLHAKKLKVELSNL